MRMWLVRPDLMCNQHLLGEHVELHMLVGSINKGISIKGYIDKGLVEIPLVRQRHKELEDEMIRRGMNHQSPLPKFSTKYVGYVDDIANKIILAERCKRCRLKINGEI